MQRATWVHFVTTVSNHRKNHGHVSDRAVQFIGQRLLLLPVAGGRHTLPVRIAQRLYGSQQFVPLAHRFCVCWTTKMERKWNENDQN